MPAAEGDSSDAATREETTGQSGAYAARRAYRARPVDRIVANDRSGLRLEPPISRGAATRRCSTSLRRMRPVAASRKPLKPPKPQQGSRPSPPELAKQIDERLKVYRAGQPLVVSR